MALKSATGKLYMLLSACLPDNDNIEKRLLLEQITESKEYRELKSYSPMKNVFLKFYSKQKLAALSTDELREVGYKTIPNVIFVVTNIINSIKYGDAWKLSLKDIPDFYSAESLNALDVKIKSVSGSGNITNIKDENFMAVFSEKTIKSLDSIKADLTVSDIENMSAAIPKHLKGKSYCISKNEIEEIKDSFDSANIELEKYNQSLRYGSFVLLCRKLLLTSICILLLVAMATSGAVGGIGLSVFALIELLIVTVYWTKV